MTPDKKAALAKYREFLGKVDSKFSEISQRNQSSFRCALGCNSCCVAGITVSLIERDNIREVLLACPQNSEFPPLEQEKRCSFLNENGACSIYDARPIVCRTQGAPLEFLEASGEKILDVCPLNFDSTNLTTLPAKDVINTETLQTILAALNILAYGKENSQKRVLLNRDSMHSIE